MTFEYDRDTAISALGNGSYGAHLSPGWAVGPAINGGYLLAIIGKAVAAQLEATTPGKGHPDPVSLSAHFLSAATPGPAYVETKVIRSGGKFSTVAITLAQDVDGAPVPRIAALATYGRQLDRTSDGEHDATSDADAAAIGLSLAPPVLAPVEECVLSSDAPAEVTEFVPLIQRFGTRFDPATAGWAVGKPSGQGVIQGWFKLIDDRPLDPIALLMVVDALPPVTFDLGMLGWPPTLELTAHVRARPAPGWVIVRHQTRTVAGGLFESDCDVWDSTGLLVAQARQLALQPRAQ